MGLLVVVVIVVVPVALTYKCGKQIGSRKSFGVNRSCDRG